MKTLIFTLCLSVSTLSIAAERISNYQSGITISTCDHDAGAICSLTWRGKEFINDYDHGRQLQSALSFDYQGEYLNPTEAGASSLTDGINPKPSSSKLLYSLASINALTTQTQMAYWNPVNGQKLSNTIHEKRVKIGYQDLSNVIEYLTEFTIPADEYHSFGQFEVLTGYMPREFSKFYIWTDKGVIPISDGPGEQNKPVILATQDGKYAMGIYSPDLPQPAYSNAGYGRWRFGDCVKWNHVFRFNNPRGTYRFRSYVVVGSLNDVWLSMLYLNNKFKK